MWIITPKLNDIAYFSHWNHQEWYNAAVSKQCRQYNNDNMILDSHLWICLFMYWEGDERKPLNGEKTNKMWQKTIFNRLFGVLTQLFLTLVKLFTLFSYKVYSLVKSYTQIYTLVFLIKLYSFQLRFTENHTNIFHSVHSDRLHIYNAYHIEPNIGTESLSLKSRFSSPYFFIFKVKLKISLDLKWILRRIQRGQC